jgi:hypothetical protein
MKLDKFRQSLACEKIEPGAVLDTARKASLVMLFGLSLSKLADLNQLMTDRTIYFKHESILRHYQLICVIYLLFVVKCPLVTQSLHRPTLGSL